MGGCIGKTSLPRATVAKVNLTSDKTLSLNVLKSLLHWLMYSRVRYQKRDKSSAQEAQGTVSNWWTAWGWKQVLLQLLYIQHNAFAMTDSELSRWSQFS